MVLPQGQAKEPYVVLVSGVIANAVRERASGCRGNETLIAELLQIVKS